MRRYQIVPGDPGFFVIDGDYIEGEHPLAVCENAEAANDIADALNIVYELNSNVLQVGTVWRKCGVQRAIVDVADGFVWYESLRYNGGNQPSTIVRMKAGQFVDWIAGAQLMRVYNPTRRRAAQR